MGFNPKLITEVLRDVDVGHTAEGTKVVDGGLSAKPKLSRRLACDGICWQAISDIDGGGGSLSPQGPR